MSFIEQTESQAATGRPRAQIDPGEVEAFASRGYSLNDIARLIGVDRATFFRHRTDDQELADAHNRGLVRWKDSGSPEPVDVKVLIENQVYALLQQREMSRPQLKDELGFRHEEINLAIESLEEKLLIQREDDVRTSWYRANGVASPCAEKRDADRGLTRVEFIQALETVSAPIGNNGDNETSRAIENPSADSDLPVNEPGNNTDYICIDCGGPRSYGSAERCKKCFDAKVAANKEPKISAKSETPRNFEVFDSRQEQKQSIPDNEVLCGCGRLLNHKGRCAYRRAQTNGDGDHSSKPDSRRGPTYKELDLAEVERVMATEETVEAGARKLGLTSAQLYVRRQKDQPVFDAVDRGRKTYYANLPENLSDDDAESHDPVSEQKKGKNEVARIEPERSGDVPVSTTMEVYGGVKLHQEVRVRVEEMAGWPAERIAEFFDALAKVVEIPQRPMPKTIKRAWSKDFESDNTEDGTVGLTYLYLVSMLHDGMEENEKQAVWTLVLYLKRMQAQVEAAKELK